MPDGYDFNRVIEIVERLLSGQDRVARQLALDKISKQRSEWEQWTRQFRVDDRELGLRSAADSVLTTLRDLAPAKHLRKNSCVWELARKNFLDVADTFQTWHTSRELKVERSHYPEYLVHLQKKLRSAATNAVAVVDEVEEFWDQKTGNEILEATPPGSKRVFVFKEARILERHFDHLLRHAEKYGTFVIAAREFYKAGAAHQVTGDFSIVTDEVTGDRVTASYDQSGRHIIFTSAEATLNRNGAAFASIIKRSHAVRPFPDDGAAYREQLISRTFSVENDGALHHSSVIPIELYDAFEEDHPFYRAMQDRMLKMLRERALGGAKQIEALEIGAGTGHFTKRLAQQRFSDVRLCAMEPDPRAVEFLIRKVSGLDLVTVMEADFLVVDPPGKYDFIFSAFAEHHIRPADKREYFRRVLDNLKPGGWFIVGDEFLRFHDASDLRAYAEAVRSYHNYIIELARDEHNWGVVRLEEAAMVSGLADESGRVDFKIDIERYRNDVSVNGLRVMECVPITPIDVAQSVGGIYVVAMQAIS